MTFGEAILQGSPRAIGSVADFVRRRGGKHADVCRAVRAFYARAGRPEPTDIEIDNWLAEADEMEGAE